MTPRVCIDSSIFIAMLKGDAPDEPDSSLCRDVLSEATRGLIGAVTSALAIVETVHLARAESEDNIAERIRQLYGSSWLQVWTLDSPLAFEASRLSRRYPAHGRNNSPHDSVFVATARLAGASQVFTLDVSHLTMRALA